MLCGWICFECTQGYAVSFQMICAGQWWNWLYSNDVFPKVFAYFTLKYFATINNTNIIVDSSRWSCCEHVIIMFNNNICNCRKCTLYHIHVSLFLDAARCSYFVMYNLQKKIKEQKQAAAGKCSSENKTGRVSVRDRLLTQGNFYWWSKSEINCSFMRVTLDSHSDLFCENET